MAKHKTRALALSYATVIYNLLEGLVSVGFALAAGSPALLGFGIDSFVESLSGMIMIWRFSGIHDDERREQRAVRLVGISLVILAAYVAYDAITALYYGDAPQPNIAGLVIAVVSLIVMPTLYLLKRRTARVLHSRSLFTDAKQTLACIMLSVALLVGTGLHYTIGWWQADPLAALVIAAYLIREGYEALAEQELCC